MTRLDQRSTCSAGADGASASERAGCPERQVRELVCKSEHLRRLGFCAVDKNQRRQRIRPREATELLRIESSAVVAADDATNHDQHAERIHGLNEVPERAGPVSEPVTLL